MREFKIAAAVAGIAAALTIATGGAAMAAPTADPSIIGGSTVDKAPWGAQIFWETEGFECSGTIIAEQWVLTAQHCKADSGGMSVKVGDVNLNKGEEAKVDKTEVSPKGDILLLHLDHAIKTDYMKLGDADPKEGDNNSIYGWGRTKDQDPPSPVLKTAKVQVTGFSTDAFGGKAIASKGVDGAAWHGDSGGPELNADGVQIGVCSTGENSGHDPNGTQNYASVATSRDFIKKTAGV